MDELSDSRLGIGAARLLSLFKESNVETNNLLGDVLQHEHDTFFGTKDSSEYKKRKARICLNVEILKSIRRLLGLRPYEEMRWTMETGASSSFRITLSNSND